MYHSVRLLRNPALLLASAVALLMGRASAQPAAGQTQPAPAFLTAPCALHARAQSLAQILSHLGGKQHINLLVDGVPLRASADIEFSGPLNQALDLIVDRFDYTWRAIGGKVILLTKRFQEPTEMPQADLPEITTMVADINQALKLQPSPGDRYAAMHLTQEINRVMQTFDPAQWQMLRTGKRLRVAELPATQRDTFERAIYISTFGPTVANWNELADLLSLLPQLELVGLKSALPDQADAGIDLKIQALGKDGEWRMVPLPVLLRHPPTTIKENHKEP